MIAYKKIAALPRIVLEPGMLQKICDWYFDNKLSPLVPPVFPKFVIQYPSGARMNIPESYVNQLLAQNANIMVHDKKPEEYPDMDSRLPERLERHVWISFEVTTELVVEYDKSLTKYTATVFDSGKRSYEYTIDYNDFVDGEWHATLSISESDKDCMESTRTHMIHVMQNVAAVQSYLLYHKPDEIPEPPRVRRAPSALSNAKKPVKRNAKQDIVIRSHKHTTITLKIDEQLPRRKYDYKTMIWNVRGHYARRGADKHMTYIAPFICRRGGVDGSSKPSRYIIKDTAQKDNL